MMFNRHGGVSDGNYGSLNISYSVGDIETNVSANRNIIRNHLQTPILISAKQVHGDSIHVVDQPPPADMEVANCDALITNQKGVSLLIQHADCQAVLIHDQHKQIVAAVHNGWRGSALNILGKTVDLLQKRFGSEPKQLQAVISPSLGPCCSEFINHRLELPFSFRKFMVRENYFDFWRISRSQLMESGLHRDAVQLPSVCTRCSRDYFSYRRASQNTFGITGRNCSAIFLHN